MSHQVTFQEYLDSKNKKVETFPQALREIKERIKRWIAKKIFETSIGNEICNWGFDMGYESRMVDEYDDEFELMEEIEAIEDKIQEALVQYEDDLPF